MEEVDDWIKKAETDLKSAQVAFDATIYDDACFHCQQCAEKSLKALHIKLTKELEKIHDLTALAKSVSAPSEICAICNDLNPYYIATRYPGSDEPIEREEALEAINKSKKVLGWIKSQV